MKITQVAAASQAQICARAVPNASHSLFHVIVTTSLKSLLLLPHFTDQEVEAQEAQAPAQGCRADGQQSQDANQELTAGAKSELMSVLLL